MPAIEGELGFFCDESALGLGLALERARRDVVYPGHRLIPEVPLGTLDPEWMPAVAGRGLVVIARDRHLRTKPAELELMRRHGLRAFWVAGKKDLSNWDSLVRLVRRWPGMETLIATRGPGPWFYALLEDGMREVPVLPP